MKRIRTYVILVMALLLSSGLLVSSGSTAVDDVISFVSEKGGDSPIILMNTQGRNTRKVDNRSRTTVQLHLVA